MRQKTIVLARISTLSFVWHCDGLLFGKLHEPLVFAGAAFPCIQALERLEGPKKVPTFSFDAGKFAEAFNDDAVRLLNRIETHRNTILVRNRRAVAS